MSPASLWPGTQAAAARNAQRLVPMLLLPLLLTVYSANAQRYVQYALNTAQVFSCVEQIPTLPGRKSPTAV